MVVSDTAAASPVQGVHNIMGGIESTGDVRLHNHRRKLKQRFDIVKKLGQGTYGKVQLGINKETGQEVAIKTIRKCKIETEADLIRIRREIQIMSSVRHPNIIHIYEVFENREKMVLVMEYAAGGELYDYLSERKVLSEDEARRIFRQIATAVYYCHKHNICHRDLKLENILLDEIGNAKIADFGLSNVFTFKALLSTFCGSPLYASPEIVKGTPYHGPEVDCWSLGVLLYTLVYGAMPFDGSNFKRLVKQISHGNYFEPKNPSPASSLIADMLNVNPARRADITAICSHQWINDTYKEMCLDLAEELASQTPVRLDLLLSLTAPAVNASNIVVDADQAAAGDGVNGGGRPIRSQSLGSIPPTAVPPTNVMPFPTPETAEVKEAVQEDKKAKPKKKERSHSRTRRKERSRSRSKKTDGKEQAENDAQTNDEAENNTAKAAAPLVNSGTQVLTKASLDDSREVPSIPAVDAAPADECREPICVEGEAKPKPVERRRSSKVYEVAEKFQPPSEKPVPKVPPPKKMILQGINVDDARKEFEKRSTSVASGSSSPPKKNSTPDSNVTADDIPFPLASTVALNKLVESAFRDGSPFDARTSETESADRAAPKLLNSSSVEGNSNKAATLPRRRTSRAEIQLIAPQLPTDSYKTEVEHFINKPAVNHKTEIVFPVNAPLPPKPLTKQDNQSREHVIPIQIEQEAPPRSKVTSPSASYATSKSSIPRTSSSSLSRQSTVDSDSGSTISTGEPIRKSPREVIIPIAVEGGGFVTPSEDTLTRMNSLNDSEDESRNGSRCFTLRSTKRRQPEKSQTAQLDTADSLSSDEDDNFQLLTAENLFSTLLSRVRSLTQRLNNDEMRRSSAFPRSLFAQHGSLFDSMPRSRITETRSFSRPESAPWRRTLSQGQVAPQRDDSIKKRYSRFFDERASVPSTPPPHDERKPPTPTGGAKPESTTNKQFEGEPPKANALSKTSSLPSNKSNIEDEFDKFFSKYKKPGDSFTLKYTTRASPIRSRLSPSTLRRCGSSRPTEEVDEARADDKHATPSKPPPRKSRFLRPDFYDTPREESKYVIQNDKVRAFRERSLSRQRDLSRNRAPSALTNGWNGDYLRSKTCSLADKMDAQQQQPQRGDFRRTISEDRTANGNDRFELTRSNSRINNGSVESFQKAKRKSLILQNELENEVRKTQNMYSKLSGLMDALNDNENQYERKLEKLYGLKRDKSPAVEETSREKVTQEALMDARESQPRNCSSSSGGGDEKASNNYDNLSLLDKKYAYFRKLRSNEQGESATDSAANESKASVSSPEDALTVASEDMDSDACSILSDGTDFENLNDRIRRRSFYTRFNNYGAAPRTTPTRPLSTYARSMSAEVGGPHRSSVSSARAQNERDPRPK